jgi:hypothetical protein
MLGIQQMLGKCKMCVISVALENWTRDGGNRWVLGLFLGINSFYQTGIAAVHAVNDARLTESQVSTRRQTSILS